MNSTRWAELMQGLALSPNPETFEQLHAAYAEKHRHYHTTAHIEDCLQKLDIVKSQAVAPENIALALWFHDAIYQPLKSDNELQSAVWATQFLKNAGASPSRIQAIHDLIMVTRHQVPANTPDEALLVDIDLSILGADADTYQEFETNVRKEYRWVPWFLYRAKRAEILQSFLNRRHIYTNEWFCRRYEASARTNLAQAITTLRGR